MNPRTPAIATFRFPVHGQIAGVDRYDLNLVIQIVPPVDDQTTGALDVLLIDDAHNLHSTARVSVLAYTNVMRRVRSAVATSDYHPHLLAISEAVQRILITE